MNPAETQANIARAVRRSRQSRAAMRSRRRRSALLLALIATSLGGAGIWSIGAATGNVMVEAALTKAKSLADLIGERTPGQRTVEALSKSRNARTLAKSRPNAKPAVHGHEENAPRIAMIDLGRLLQSPPDIPAEVAPPTLYLDATLPSLDATPPSIAKIVSPPPGSDSPGGSVPPGGLGSPKIVVPVPSAVPEPGAWAMMLVGFTLVGLRVRRRPKTSGPSCSKA
jgi:hypothetical protein